MLESKVLKKINFLDVSKTLFCPGMRGPPDSRRFVMTHFNQANQSRKAGRGVTGPPGQARNFRARLPDEILDPHLLSIAVNISKGKHTILQPPQPCMFKVVFEGSLRRLADSRVFYPAKTFPSCDVIGNEVPAACKRVTQMSKILPWQEVRIWTYLVNVINVLTFASRSQQIYFTARMPLLFAKFCEKRQARMSSFMVVVHLHVQLKERFMWDSKNFLYFLCFDTVQRTTSVESATATAKCLSPIKTSLRFTQQVGPAFFAYA